MRFLTEIVDALVGFVQRNPLTVLVILLLALGAPALLKGIALFVLYFLLGIVLLGIVLMLLFRWRLRRVQRQMEERFGRDFGGDAQGGFGSPSGGGARARAERQEGEVKVYRTAETPEKRVSSDVGDYVDFEETKE